MRVNLNFLKYSNGPRWLLFVSAIAWFCSCDKKAPDMGTDSRPEPVVQQKPALTGKISFHNYSSYGSGDSKLYIYDFKTNQLSQPSADWNIVDPMNGHFSPDGLKLVFMGREPDSDDWDVFIWTVGSSAAPINLTGSYKTRDEDPKFSPDGASVVFKQNGDLKTLNPDNGIVSDMTNTSSEESMPFYTADGERIVYAKGAGEGSDIYMIDLDGTNDQPLANNSGIQEYYPIVRDSISFLYSRWYSATNRHDQVFMGNFSNHTTSSLPFNTDDADYSDAFPCGTDFVILSSSRSGGKGGYDLYIADIATGNIWSLDLYNSSINTGEQELGVCYIMK